MSRTLSPPTADPFPSLRHQARPPRARGVPWLVEQADETVAVVRRRGDPEPTPSCWRQRLARALRSMPGVVAVAARRLRPDGTLFSMGEMVIHPKGFHHVGQGLDGGALRFVEEVDAACGGVVAVSVEALAAAGGRDRLDTGEPLALMELCLELRRAGGRVVTVPDVTITDEFVPEPDPSERTAFRRRLGFDCWAPDLDRVRARPSLRGLLWNLRLHHPVRPFDKYEHRPALHWRAYDEVSAYRQRADHLARLVRQVTGTARVLDLGCGDGLFSHLVGLTGPEVIGIDPHDTAVRQAAEAVGRFEYPGRRPAFRTATGEALPFDAGSFGSVLMFDVIEHLSNPVRVLRECERVLACGGHLVVTTPHWRHGAWSDPVHHVCEYTEPELVRQVHAATDLKVVTTGRITGVYRDIVLVAGKAG